MDTYDKIQEELEELSKSKELKYTESSLLKLKKEELVDMCKERELAVSGTKSVLVERILEHEGVLEAESTITFTSEDKEKEKDVVGKAERV